MTTRNNVGLYNIYTDNLFYLFQKIGMSSLPPIDFTSLPLEVIEQITHYLSTNDLLACSLVSISWRESLNYDILWVKQCKGGYGWKRYAEHLENQKSQVEPFFELPECVEKTLEPLCKWRVHFMTQIHFERNLQTNGNKKYTSYGNFNTESVYYEAENTVVMYSGTNCCEVWNTEGSPFRQDLIYCAIDENSPFLYVFDNFILILQSNLLQVYEKSDGKYKLLHRRCFDQNENIDIPPDVDITQWFWNFIENKSNSFKVLKNYTSPKGIICFQNIFIGCNVTSDLTNGIFYIWDIKTGFKLKEQRFIDCLNHVSDIDFYKTKELVYILLETEGPCLEKKVTIVGYNALTQNYTNFCIEINSGLSERYFYFERNYVVTLYSNVIDIWDTKTDNKNKTYKDLDTRPFPFAFIIHNSQLIYAGNAEFSNYLLIIDIKTLKKIKTLNIRSPIYRLMSSEANLLLMKCNTSDFYNFSRDIFEYKIIIWNLEIDGKIYSFKIVDQFSGHLKFTKVISVQPNEFSVIHFW